MTSTMAAETQRAGEAFLSERFSGLKNIPRCSLANLPTPVEPLERLSEALGRTVWCKRDDQTDAVRGGSKTRKLEFIIGDLEARRSDVLITRGSVGSHHAMAAALAAKKIGIETHVFMCGQELDRDAEQTFRSTHATGAIFHPSPKLIGGALDRWRMHLFAKKLRARGRQPTILGLGGTSPVSTVAHIEAAFELAHQIDQGELPAPETIYVPLGSGSSAVGLAIGFALLGRPIRVVAVRVAHPLYVHRFWLQRLIADTVQLLQRHDPSVPDIEDKVWDYLDIDHQEYEPGYSIPNPRALRAIEMLGALENIELEVTYTGRTAAALIRDAEAKSSAKPVLYWHTFAKLPETDPPNQGPLPQWVQQICT